MKIKKTEPKNKNLYYKWFDNTGEYDIWYKKPTMIFHYKEDKIPMELKSFLDKWSNKMENYKIDYVENYPVKLAEIEFIYKDRECAITNHTSRWWFYDGVEQVEICEFRNFELLVSKVAKYIVEDRIVQDIFDGDLYENVSIL